MARKSHHDEQEERAWGVCWVMPGVMLAAVLIVQAFTGEFFLASDGSSAEPAQVAAVKPVSLRP